MLGLASLAHPTSQGKEGPRIKKPHAIIYFLNWISTTDIHNFKKGMLFILAMC